MSITVEDGTLVADANSYVSRADYIAYAASVGVTIADDADADIELIKAAQFIDSHEANLKGVRVERDQAMAFPRYGVTIDGWAWGEDEVPRAVILCQLNLAVDIHAGIDPFNPPPNPNRATKREKVEGAVEVEYMGDGAGQKLGRDSRAQALLSSLLLRNGLTSITLERI